MKRAVYQVAVGERTPLYNKCIGSVQKYCIRHRIEHIVQTTPILKIRPKNSHRSKEAVERLGYLPIYEKENAFSLLDEYDYVAIVDSDILVVDDSRDIFDGISSPLSACVERDMPFTDQYFNKVRGYGQSQYQPLKDVNWHWNNNMAHYYNMGLMVMHKDLRDYLNGDTPEEFIRRPEFERFVNGEGAWRWSTDQTLLNYWVKKEKIPVYELPWTWNCLFGAVRDDQIKKARFVHFFLSDNLPNKGEDLLDTKFGGHK